MLMLAMLATQEGGGYRNTPFLGFRRRSVRLFRNSPDLPGESGEPRCGCGIRFAAALWREATKKLFEVGPAPEARYAYACYACFKHSKHKHNGVLATSYLAGEHAGLASIMGGQE